MKITELKGNKTTIKLNIEDMDTLMGSRFVERNKHEKNKPTEAVIEISSPIVLKYSLLFENGITVGEQKSGVTIPWETFRKAIDRNMVNKGAD